MTVSVGFTTAEIREFVHEYQLQQHGQKQIWLDAQGITRRCMARWRDMVFAGDLERGLVPRESSAMAMTPRQRTALEKQRAWERAEHEAELARLTARVQELEGTNEALGKAIGLLHWLNEQEPAEPGPTTNEQSSS